MVGRGLTNGWLSINKILPYWICGMIVKANSVLCALSGLDQPLSKPNTCEGHQAARGTKRLGAPQRIEKLMAKDNIECAFQNLWMSLLIFFTLMVSNCSAERLFSQLKNKNPNRTTMKKEKLDSFSLLMIESNFSRKVNFDDIIKNFARHMSTKKEL